MDQTLQMSFAYFFAPCINLPTSEQFLDNWMRIQTDSNWQFAVRFTHPPSQSLVKFEVGSAEVLKCLAMAQMLVIMIFRVGASEYSCQFGKYSSLKHELKTRKYELKCFNIN